MTDIDDVIARLQAHAVTDAAQAAQVVSLQAALDAAKANDATDAATIASLQAQVAVLEQWKKDHTPTPPPPPPPPVSTTLYGACPAMPAGATLASAMKVVNKWGGNPSLRQFLGGWTNVAQRPSAISIAHYSWNTLTGMTEASVKAALVNVRDGDVVEVIHEGDHKVSKGSITLPALVSGKNAFYDIVKKVRPNVLVANTLTGGVLANYTADSVAAPYGAIKADVLGVDCDGVHDSTPPLSIAYEDEIAKALAFAKKYGYKHVAAPEFGTSRPPFDTDGSQRAAWAAKYGNQFKVAAFLYVCLYDYESTPGNEFVAGSPEFKVWQSMVATNSKG